MVSTWVELLVTKQQIETVDSRQACVVVSTHVAISTHCMNACAEEKILICVQ